MLLRQHYGRFYWDDSVISKTEQERFHVRASHRNARATGKLQYRYCNGFDRTDLYAVSSGYSDLSPIADAKCAIGFGLPIHQITPSSQRKRRNDGKKGVIATIRRGDRGLGFVASGTGIAPSTVRGF
jgi:hypothetical protein